MGWDGEQQLAGIGLLISGRFGGSSVTGNVKQAGHGVIDSLGLRAYLAVAKLAGLVLGRVRNWHLRLGIKVGNVEFRLLGPRYGNGAKWTLVRMINFFLGGDSN